jgi:hypothetical protein
MATPMATACRFRGAGNNVVSTMANEHIQNLRKARGRFVDLVHTKAKLVADGTAAADGMATQFIEIRRAIDAIDDAIVELEDEEDE